jgi:hypothetical protein
LVASLLALGVATALLLGLIATHTAQAKGSRQATSSGLALSYEYVWNNPNPAAPGWCQNEDDWHVRTWTGSLNGTFPATEQLCDASLDGWDAGGIGLQADLFVAGTLSDLAITSPLGDSHHAVFVDSTTTKKHVTINHYQVCYVPPFTLLNDIGFNPLAGGIWQLTLAGNVTHVNLTFRSRMADVGFQQQYCPPSEQNLV